MRPDQDTRAALEILLEEHISGAPVVDASGGLLGVLSQTDLLLEVAERAGPEASSVRVGQVMTPLVLAVYETVGVPQAAALMASEGVHRLLVVSAAGDLVGILSSLDVMRWLGERAGYLDPPVRNSFVGRR